MDRLIYTGLNALANMRAQRVTQAQNLANQAVPGFRRDLTGAEAPKFLDALGSVATRAFQKQTGEMAFSQEQGFLERTGQATDVAIDGAGYFVIQPDSGDPALSRRGDLRRDPEGFLRDGAGALMLDPGMQPVELPPFRQIHITDLGEIRIEPLDGAPGQTVPAGVLGTVRPDADTVLRKGPDGQIRTADGTVPEPNQRAAVVQGALERSNVNPVGEMLANIEMQRNFEIGLRTILSAQELDEAGAALLRPPEA